MPAAAAFETVETFNTASDITQTDFAVLNYTYTAGYGGTVPIVDGNATLTPKSAYAGVGITNTQSNWKHLRATVTPRSNGRSNGYSYGSMGISSDSTVSLKGTNAYFSVLDHGVYVTFYGTSTDTLIILNEAWYSGGTRYTKASPYVTIPTIDNKPTTFDLISYGNGTSAVYLNGVQKSTLETNETSGGILIYQGAYADAQIPTIDIDSVSLSSTAQYIGPTPGITWSSPDEVTTTQYDAVPTFSFTSDLPVNYTVTQGENVVTGSGTTYTYTPEYNGYNDYTATFNLEHPALLENITKTYTWHYIAAPTDQVPVLSEFSPATDQTIYQYQTVPFSTDVIGAIDGYPLLSDVVWAVNGSTAQTNTSVTTADYDYTGSTVGDFLISSSVTNPQGTDSESKTVSVLPNSMTISNMEYTPSGDENGVIISFTASNFTAGIPIHGWAPKDFNHTVADKVYTWNYENGTTINYETATSNGEALDFDLATVPEGNYTIRIVSEPVADYSYTFYMDGTQPVVSFEDMSVGGATSILWDFGDSETSTEASPTHTYAAEGTYTVNLTRTNILGTDSKVVEANISSLLLPATSFTKNTTGGFAPVTVQFNDTSTNATGWSWNFGDGYTTTAQNPVHTYNSEDLYSVTLTASNSAGTSTASDTINILKSANFTMSPESGTAPLTVKFTDTSINAESWRWDFENDGVIDSNMQNPLHTYGNVGYYPVNLSITTPDGNTSMIYYVNVNPTSITTLNQLWWFLQSLKFWVIAPAVV